MVGEVESGEQSAFLRYSDTEKAGPYQLFIGDDPKPKVVFAVLSDPEESNLAQQPKADIDPLLNATAPAAGAEENAPDKSTTGHRRVPGRNSGSRSPLRH